MLLPIGLLLAFFLPGGLLSKLLLNRFHLSFAFLASNLLLTLTLTALCILRQPVTLPIVSAILSVLSLLLAATLIYRQKTSPPLPPLNPAPRNPSPAITLRLIASSPLLLTLCAATFFLTACFIYKQALTPIPGYDTSIRWEYLAARIFEQGNASFYPPISDAHFALYALPDAMGLMVASGYWWSYALAGQSSAHHCVPLIILQFLMILHAGWSLAKALSGSLTARCLAIFLLAVTGVITTNTLIGQESGILILAGLLLLCLLIGFRARPSIPLAIAIGLTAGAAALTREYAAGYLLIALGSSFWPSSSLPSRGKLGERASFANLKFPLIITLTFALTAGPWLLHVWLLTGNPFYSIGLLGLFPKHPDLWARLMSHASRLSIANLPVWFTTRHPYACLLQALPGLLGLFALWKLKSVKPRATSNGRGVLIFAFALMMFIFFIWGYFPSLGDPYYSFRVAAPGIAALTVALALYLSTTKLFSSKPSPGTHSAPSPSWPRLRWVLIAILTIHASLTLLIRHDYPWRPPSQWPALAFTPGLPGDQVTGYPILTRAFIQQDLPLFQNQTILSSDAYLQRALIGLPVRVLPPWSPSASIVMDPSLQPLAVRRQLLQQGISFIIVTPSSPVEGTWQLNSPWFAADAENLNPRAPLGPNTQIRAIPPHTP